MNPFNYISIFKIRLRYPSRQMWTVYENGRMYIPTNFGKSDAVLSTKILPPALETKLNEAILVIRIGVEHALPAFW